MCIRDSDLAEAVMKIIETEPKTYGTVSYTHLDVYKRQVKYLEYMLNAREDHVESGYGFTYEEYTKKTGCTWAVSQTHLDVYKRQVLDKSNNISVIFLDKRYDYTDKVLDLLLKNVNTKKLEAEPAKGSPVKTQGVQTRNPAAAARSVEKRMNADEAKAAEEAIKK